MAKKTARTTRTPKRPSDPWPVFLRELKRTANVSVACHKAVVGRTAAYGKRKTDEEFAAAWDEAIEEAIEALEEVARRRAVTLSDTLLIFLLKAHRPEKYREIRESRLTGPDGGAIKADVNVKQPVPPSPAIIALLSHLGVQPVSGIPDAVRTDSSPESLDTARSNGQAGHLSPAG